MGSIVSQRRRAALAVLAVVAGLLAAPERSNADEDAALEAFEKGVELYKKERYEAAVKSFRWAHELKPTFKLFFNIGQCEAAMRRYGLAMEAFERYLGEGGDDVDLERKDYVLAEMRRLREMVGTLEIEAPADLAVVVDGEERGLTPLAAGVRVTAGVDHEVALYNDGVVVFHRAVTVGSAQAVKVELDDGDLSPVAGTGTAPEAREEDEADDEEVTTAERKKLEPVFFWVGVGATGLFGVSTIAFELATRAKWEDAEADPGDSSLRDQGRALQGVGIAALCLTGVAAVTTAVIAGFTDFGGEEEEPGVAIAPLLREGGGGLGLRGRF